MLNPSVFVWYCATEEGRTVPGLKNVQAGHSGTYLQSHHLEDTGSVKDTGSRPAWSTKGRKLDGEHGRHGG